MKRLAFIAALFALPLQAQDIDETAPAIVAIMETARAECATDIGDPNAQLMVEPGAITWLDLDGEQAANDTVIDFNHILCPQNFSLWHGSGGSTLHFVLNGEISRSWSGGFWRVTEFNGSRLILLGRHGGWCDSFGARACVQAISADEEGFWTVTDPLPFEEQTK